MLLRTDKVETMKHSLQKRRNACLLTIIRYLRVKRLRTCCPLWWCKDPTQVAGHLPAKYSICQQFSSYFVEAWVNFWMLKIKMWYYGTVTINNSNSNYSFPYPHPKTRSHKQEMKKKYDTRIFCCQARVRTNKTCNPMARPISIHYFRANFGSKLAKPFGAHHQRIKELFQYMWGEIIQEMIK